jgi:hypothetical protein
MRVMNQVFSFGYESTWLRTYSIGNRMRLYEIMKSPSYEDFDDRICEIDNSSCDCVTSEPKTRSHTTLNFTLPSPFSNIIIPAIFFYSSARSNDVSNVNGVNAKRPGIRANSIPDSVRFAHLTLAMSCI